MHSTHCYGHTHQLKGGHVSSEAGLGRDTQSTPCLHYYDYDLLLSQFGT